MPSYADRLKSHLAGYKRNQLGIAEDGTWSRNGKPYAHILPDTARELNLLAPIRTAFWQYAAREGLTRQMHRDFGHLNSSQALAFNLFFSFAGLSWSQPELLLAALDVVGNALASFRFESVPDPEEGTNFDFVATLADGAQVLVEVKLSESEFGRCRADEEHERKRCSLYVGRLAGKVVDEALQPAAFFTNYQLLRNVSHLRPHDALVLLVPRSNTGTFAQASSFISTFVEPGWRSRIKLVALEDLIERLCGMSPNSSTSEMLTLLREKYIVPNAV